MPKFNTVRNRTHRTKDRETIFVHQAERLGQYHRSQETNETGSTQAAEAKFVAPQDPVIETTNGGRLPVVPVDEALKLNRPKEKTTGVHPKASPPNSAHRRNDENSIDGQCDTIKEDQSEKPDALLDKATLRSRTNPLFPPLPLYGPPTLLRSVQCFFFRISSAVLSLCFLLTVVAGAIAHSVPEVLRNVGKRARLQDPKKRRPFYEEEVHRRKERRAAENAWVQQQRDKDIHKPPGEKGNDIPTDDEFIPSEGGPDPLYVDVGYYARRVGLDMETFEVQTEDGFIIELWHLINPRDTQPVRCPDRKSRAPDVLKNPPRDSGFAETQPFPSDKKYPVLMIPGLLQSAGAFCCNDDDSLAFYLAKSGYDVWLGNNRCGVHPKHTMLESRDPRFWAWNIRQMGNFDLAAMLRRVLTETGFPKLALIAHSQGTTETFVALAKGQRPDIGEKISVFCALAPAAYAGPLIGKIYFKVMRLISPAVFRVIFGIHAFIPLMMFAHRILPARLYSWMAYHVFSYLFSWSDSRWERDLRDRMFQWAPVYVSAESMRWWLGRECFAKQKCILATRKEARLEDKEDDEDDEVVRRTTKDREQNMNPRKKLQRNISSFHCLTEDHLHHDSKRGRYAWYNKQCPPFALWIAGSDDLVDGRRLLRRFDRGREPYVKVVHRKIIDEYEHLDVIWAMDAIEKVGKEVREVIWRTVDRESAAVCRVPVGCSKSLEEEPDIQDDVPMMHSGGRLRMASISEARPTFTMEEKRDGEAAAVSPTCLDPAIGAHGEHEDKCVAEQVASPSRRLSEPPFTDL